MSGFIRCIVYLSVIGVAFFLVGRILPKKWFCADKIPFRSFNFEKNGNVYVNFGIKKWKDGLPDMSRIVPILMPSKKMPTAFTIAQLEAMIQETCIAEWIHGLLCVMGYGCVFLWEGKGGWLAFLIYALGNIPYIMIQRYNRPKLMRILKKMRTKENDYINRKQESVHEKGDYTELQYGTRS